MLKIRLIAALVALVMTLLTIYLIPIAAALYTGWTRSLNTQEQQWFSYSQIALGAVVALAALWHWKKKRARNKG